MIGSSSRIYADTCFLCRSSQSSDTAAPNPIGTAVVFLHFNTVLAKCSLTLNGKHALAPL